MPPDPRDFVVQYLRRKGSLPVDDLDGFRYAERGLIDSLGMLRFLTLIEEEYGFVFADEELLSQEFRTVGGLVAIIRRRMS